MGAPPPAANIKNHRIAINSPLQFLFLERAVLSQKRFYTVGGFRFWLLCNHNLLDKVNVLNELPFPAFFLLKRVS